MLRLLTERQVYPVAHLPLWISGSLHEYEPKQTNNELAIVNWCRVRDIVSLAATSTAIRAVFMLSHLRPMLRWLISGELKNTPSSTAASVNSLSI